ncbi:MAG: hypothetical protein JWL68_2160 [Actinomycetia bacterium]|nr:hypothetical protein [Actinomycetes bacterium]
MTDDPDAQLVSAAETIRDELDTLVPVDAETLGAALDEHIAKARAAPAAERPATVVDIVKMLTRHEPTRRRLVQLVPITVAERGVAAAGAWASDQILAGSPADVWAQYWTLASDPADDKGDEGLVKIICQTCRHENKLAFLPPADDPPQCQNPEGPSHPLKMP